MLCRPWYLCMEIGQGYLCQILEHDRYHRRAGAACRNSQGQTGHLKLRSCHSLLAAYRWRTELQIRSWHSLRRHMLRYDTGLLLKKELDHMGLKLWYCKVLFLRDIENPNAELHSWTKSGWTLEEKESSRGAIIPRNSHSLCPLQLGLVLRRRTRMYSLLLLCCSRHNRTPLAYSSSRHFHVKRLPVQTTD